MSAFRWNRALTIVLATFLLLPMTPLLGTPSAQAGQTFGATPLDDVRYWAAQEARCGLSADKLAALMLAPTFPETGATPSTSPSPMTMSRWDNQSGLHSFGSSSSYRNAFWHPGIGPWQFDSAGLGTYSGANGRIDTFVAAAHAADTMATRWCASSGSDWSRRAHVWAPWYGCGSNKCQTIFSQIFNGSSLVGMSTQSGVSRLGGMQQRNCTGPGHGGTFPCWRVDPAQAQGHNAFAAPAYGPSPITSPFYVYTAGGHEYRHWLRADTGYDTGIWATRPLGANARSGLKWHTGEVLTDLGAPPPPPPPGPGPDGFYDVEASDWFIDGVLWAVEQGIMTGYPDETFKPAVTLNRAQAIMAMWRAQGEPETEAGHEFTDAPPTAWFDTGLRWAADAGIVEGYPDGTFRPYEPLNRAQYVMMLWRLAARPVADTVAGFTDTRPSQWFVGGMSWAAERGYMVGFPNGSFQPYEPMTRAQAVMAFWRARQFDDVAPTAAYAPAVDWARHRGVVQGFPDHTYHPDDAVQRGQIVSILFETMDAPPGSPPHAFTDVAPGAWNAASVDWAAAAGVVSGYPDGTFRPTSPVGRAQLVMMLWRMAGSPEVTDPHGLADVPAGAWYEAGARWAVANGILDDVTSGAFEPLHEPDRAEMATLLANLATSANAWSPSVTPPSTVVF